MKWIVLFGVNLILSFQIVLSSYGSENDDDISIPSPPCCHSKCCCSHCPRESCLRSPEDSTVLHPCSCDQSLQYSCTQNPNPVFPTLIPPFPMNNYQMPPLPYPVNPLYPQSPFPGSPQYPNPRPYPIVIEPQPSRPISNPGYMKSCLCGNNVVPTCQPILPCGNNQNYNNNYYGSWNSWDSWNLNFLETPQGIAVLILAIVLLLLIICLIIGLIIACIRSRKSRVVQVERDYERNDKLNDNNFQPANDTKKGRIKRKN